MKTYSMKNKDIKREWYIIDASNKILGRISTSIASILRGKNKPEFTPNVDMGDNVIIINASKIKLSANKEDKKVYKKYTGYVGNLKTVYYKDLIKKHPEKIIMHSVKGMLPKNKLGRKMLSKLFIYFDEKHPHVAQKPKFVE